MHSGTLDCIRFLPDCSLCTKGRMIWCQHQRGLGKTDVDGRWKSSRRSVWQRQIIGDRCVEYEIMGPSCHLDWWQDFFLLCYQASLHKTVTVYQYCRGFQRWLLMGSPLIQLTLPFPSGPVSWTGSPADRPKGVAGVSWLVLEAQSDSITQLRNQKMECSMVL